MTKPTVFIPEPIAACGMELLADSCECVAPWRDGRTLSRSEQNALLDGADAVIVRLFPIDRADLHRAARLKVIAKHGVGVDTIDCQAATERRILVLYTPAATSTAVAEHTLALLLGLSRQLVPAAQAMSAGRFQDRGRFEGVELAGKTLGVVGLGRIGARVAHMASLGLAMDVRGYDPLLSRASYRGLARLVDSLEALLRASDFVTFHLPLNPQTRHLLNEQKLGWLKPTCRIVNTSRGAIIDEAALVRALEQGRLAGAALDVFEVEPLPANHPLTRLPNVLLTPHLASSTRESLDRMARDAVQGVLDVFAGRAPRYPLNPEVLSSGAANK